MKPDGPTLPRWWTHPEEEDDTYELREEDDADDVELAMRTVSPDRPVLEVEPADDAMDSEPPLAEPPLAEPPRAEPQPVDIQETGGDGTVVDAQISPDNTETAVRARGEARGLLDRAAADEDDQKSSISPHVTVSGGRRAHKQTVMTELNVLAPGHELSSDRLARISKASDDVRRSDDATITDAEPGHSMFGIGVDFAMAFTSEDGTVTAEFGRVERMKGKAGGGKRKIWREPFELTADRPDVHVHARWYSCMPNAGNTFKYDVSDTSAYDIEHVISIVDLEYDDALDTYRLDDRTARGISEAVAQLQRSRATDASAARVMRQQQQTAAARAARLQMEGATTFIAAGTSRYGRGSTRIE